MATDPGFHIIKPPGAYLGLVPRRYQSGEVD
jgi:transposase